jgi:TM2 domain-containing membrane protein YozV
MPSVTVCFRYWLPLLALLLLGSCQRASYSFQATSSVLSSSLVVASALGAPEPAAMAGMSVPAPRQSASQLRFQHKRAAQRLPKALTRRVQLLPMLVKQVTALPRVTSHLAAKQEPTPGDSPTHWRTKGIALLLAFFLGGIGAHLFYLGYYGRAIAYLAATVVGLVFLAIALVMAVASIYGGGAGFIAIATISTIITAVVSVLALVDLVRIAIGDLKPKNGEYFPGFFQTHKKQ